MKIAPKLVLVTLLGGFFGCGSPDVYIRNPVVSGAVDANRVLKTHGYTENYRGLPPGSVADEATIVALNAQQICIQVTLHELTALDLNAAKVRMVSNTGEVPQASVQAEPPGEDTYNGMNPVRTQTGSRQVCTYRYGQSVCETQPIYSTTMVPGPVAVYRTRGQVCAPNSGLVTPATKKLTLKIEVPTARMPGQFAGGKDADFTWGFGG